MHEAPDSTRVVFDISAAVDYKVFTLEKPNRVVVDLTGVRAAGNFDPSVIAVGRKRVSGLRAAYRDRFYRVVIDTKEALNPKAFTLKPIEPYGHRLVVDLFTTDSSPLVSEDVRQEAMTVPGVTAAEEMDLDLTTPTMEGHALLERDRWRCGDDFFHRLDVAAE